MEFFFSRSFPYNRETCSQALYYKQRSETPESHCRSPDSFALNSMHLLSMFAAACVCFQPLYIYFLTFLFPLDIFYTYFHIYFPAAITVYEESFYNIQNIRFRVCIYSMRLPLNNLTELWHKLTTYPPLMLYKGSQITESSSYSRKCAHREIGQYNCQYCVFLSSCIYIARTQLFFALSSVSFYYLFLLPHDYLRKVIFT